MAMLFSTIWKCCGTCLLLCISEQYFGKDCSGLSRLDTFWVTRQWKEVFPGFWLTKLVYCEARRCDPDPGFNQWTDTWVPLGLKWHIRLGQVTILAWVSLTLSMIESFSCFLSYALEYVQNAYQHNNWFFDELKCYCLTRRFVHNTVQRIF